MMGNGIEACKKSGSKLVFLDNVYMCGYVDGVMTETCESKPISKKGQVRMQIADMLMSEFTSGGLQDCIARSADFYGKGAKNGVLNAFIIDPILKEKKPIWLGSSQKLHSFTYVPDAAKAMVTLGLDDKAN
jgi:nucleoside-diphosphate-sugar epimerase